MAPVDEVEALVVHCGCCGAPAIDGGPPACKCDVQPREGRDSETGPWFGWYCTFHRCAADAP